MTPATYIGTDSAQLTAGTAGFLSDVTRRRAWFSVDADDGRGLGFEPRPDCDRACITCSTLRGVDTFHPETEWPRGHVPSGLWRVRIAP